LVPIFILEKVDRRKKEQHKIFNF